MSADLTVVEQENRLSNFDSVPNTQENTLISLDNAFDQAWRTWSDRYGFNPVVYLTSFGLCAHLKDIVNLIFGAAVTTKTFIDANATSMIFQLGSYIVLRFKQRNPDVSPEYLVELAAQLAMLSADYESEKEGEFDKLVAFSDKLFTLDLNETPGQVLRFIAVSAVNILVKQALDIREDAATAFSFLKMMATILSSPCAYEATFDLIRVDYLSSIKKITKQITLTPDDLPILNSAFCESGIMKDYIFYEMYSYGSLLRSCGLLPQGILFISDGVKSIYQAAVEAATDSAKTFLRNLQYFCLQRNHINSEPFNMLLVMNDMHYASDHSKPVLVDGLCFHDERTVIVTLQEGNSNLCRIIHELVHAADAILGLTKSYGNDLAECFSADCSAVNPDQLVPGSVEAVVYYYLHTRMGEYGYDMEDMEEVIAEGVTLFVIDDQAMRDVFPKCSEIFADIVSTIEHAVPNVVTSKPEPSTPSDAQLSAIVRLAEENLPVSTCL